MAEKRSVGEHIRHAFYPTDENDRHPHLLRRNAVASILALAICVEIGLLAGGSALIARSLTASVLPSVVTWLTNDAREKSKLQPLTVNTTLAAAAQKKANDMAARGYFAHKDPDGKLPWFWFDSVGYNYKLAGENLAVNFSDSDKLVAAWLASPAHRANIMKSGYSEIGIGMSSLKKAAGGSTSVATAPVSANSNVLGVQTERISTWDRVLASPETYATYVLSGFFALFMLLVLLSIVPLPQRWPHPNAVINGLAALVLLLGIMLINQNAVNAVNLPADGQNAAVSAAF